MVSQGNWGRANNLPAMAVLVRPAVTLVFPAIAWNPEFCYLSGSRNLPRQARAKVELDREY